MADAKEIAQGTAEGSRALSRSEIASKINVLLLQIKNGHGALGEWIDQGAWSTAHGIMVTYRRCYTHHLLDDRTAVKYLEYLDSGCAGEFWLLPEQKQEQPFRKRSKPKSRSSDNGKNIGNEQASNPV